MAEETNIEQSKSKPMTDKELEELLPRMFRLMSLQSPLRKNGWRPVTNC